MKRTRVNSSQSFASFVVLAVLAAGALTACSSTPTSETSDAADPGASAGLGLLKDGEVSVGFMNGLMPYIGMENGKVTGVDGDLFQLAADDLGLNVNAAGMEFSAMIAGVQAGRYDIGIGGVAWTEERSKAGSFTDPVYYSPALLLTAPGIEIKTIADMDGLTIGAATGSMNDDAVRATPGAIAKSYPAWANAITDLQAGRLDAVNIDPLTAVYMRDTNPDLSGFGTYVVQAPTDEEVAANPGLQGFRPYQVVWYCSPKAEALCDSLSDVIRGWYDDGTSVTVLEDWGVDAQSFLTSSDEMTSIRVGVDRDENWTAPTLKASE
ncbi:hypothetical protein GCM10022381_34880 [Leifsonia kafniensis]|uniref:Solute-binding protein family 3/N-terminal domain-containing protein n=1 Tax=Leifsonia kafniensis TaxID=475957 RepID=A0ABP7KWT0_9MICO